MNLSQNSWTHQAGEMNSTLYIRTGLFSQNKGIHYVTWGVTVFRVA